MNYDMMTTHELLMQIVDRVSLTDVKLGDIESALRTACIREASVGMVEVTCEDASSGWLKVRAGSIPNGDYDLIPKVTP